eukprot:755961-Hanusia_phi.AAC.8
MESEEEEETAKNALSCEVQTTAWEGEGMLSSYRRANCCEGDDHCMTSTTPETWLSTARKRTCSTGQASDRGSFLTVPRTQDRMQMPPSVGIGWMRMKE